MDIKDKEKIVNELEDRIESLINIDDHGAMRELEYFLDWFTDEFCNSTWAECEKRDMRLNHRINNEGEREFGYTCHRCGYSEWECGN